MAYLNREEVSVDLVNDALAGLAERIGSLVVSNALLAAENRLLLAALGRAAAEDEVPADPPPSPAPAPAADEDPSTPA